METTGIAQVAAEKGMPLLSLRAVSDGTRSPIPFDLEAMMDEEDNLRIGKMIKMALRQPSNSSSIPADDAKYQESC